MRQVTLCFLLRDGEICLAMKKRGFGAGKWNGMGGKVSADETLEEATIRELEEEAAVVAKTENLELVATIQFIFPQSKADWTQEVHVFFIREWSGEPTETEEMAPRWFALADIPYDSMWIDDPIWLPKVLDGKKINASFYLSEDGSEILKSEIVEV